jgi:hypothetical protein
MNAKKRSHSTKRAAKSSPRRHVVALGGAKRHQSLERLSAAYAAASTEAQHNDRHVDAIALAGIASALRYLALSAELFHASEPFGSFGVAIKARAFDDVFGGGIDLQVTPPEAQYLTKAERFELSEAARLTRVAKLDELAARPAPEELSPAQREARASVLEHEAGWAREHDGAGTVAS